MDKRPLNGLLIVADVTKQSTTKAEFTNKRKDIITITQNNRQVRQQVFKMQIVPYGLSQLPPPVPNAQFRILNELRCTPPALGRQEMRSSAAAAWCLQRAHTIRMQAGWVLAALNVFFVPGDLDL